MPVKSRRERRPVLDDDQIKWFKDGIDHCFFWDEPERQRDWKAVRDEILADWIAQRPGTRPYFWWIADAPEPRLRVGGTGVTSSEKYPAALPCHRFGLPRYWEDIEDADPPRYESQAAYLKRHRLFAAGEEKRLTDADFTDEVIR